MSSIDLTIGAQKLPVYKTCVTTCGYPDRLSFRLQPNHTTDDIDAMRITYMEGFSYCVGDALFGMNPVDDTIGNVDRVLRDYWEFTRKWEIPTQVCCLAHVTTQMACIKEGAPSDMIFQSIAGSQIANDAFGVNIAMLDEAEDLMHHQGTGQGQDVLYFEPGEGAALSADGHWGADQLTMEARCYGLAKRYHPYLVDSVVGFIGPEYLYDAKQVARAGMEDHFMGKLLGISMGCDACYTNHMKCDQNDNENLEILLAAAGCNFFMSVPLRMTAC
jgi:ethanolamine ammonia-lyase large subunit